jgi:hypothetical protein
MQDHLDADDPLAVQLRDRFFPGQSILRVPIIARGRTGQCYANVIDYIAKNGGSTQLGWLISYLPGRYVEATHHAVWRDTNGELHDVTDKAFPKMKNDESSFVEDHENDPPTDYWHPAVPSWFLVLDESSAIKQYVRAVRSATVAFGQFQAAARQTGIFSLSRLPSGDIALRGRLNSPQHPVALLHRQVEKARAEKNRLQSLLTRI